MSNISKRLFAQAQSDPIRPQAAVKRIQADLRRLITPTVWAAMVVCAIAYQSQSNAKPIARVALAVGESLKLSGDQSERLRAGTYLLAGDRIRTGTDGVVILVFSDEGRVSVRPESELWIKHYDVDPKGVNTRIELELVRGTVRQISGNASRSQPERYRLSTPVAAIGVRGTDFLARASSQGVETLVQEGKIFVQANNLQSCAQIDCGALLGPAQSAGSYLRVSANGDIEQRAYRTADVEQSFALNLVMQPTTRRQTLTQVTELQRLKISEAELPTGAQFISDTIFMVSQNKDLSYEGSTAAGESASGSSAAGGSASGSSGQPSPPSTPDTPGTPTNLATNTAALLERQLVWGRFSQASALPDQWVVSYADAKDGRHVTVGELGQYALWRNGATGRIDASLVGVASFNLVGAQAVLDQSGAISAASVNGASLEVNFDRSSFLAGVDLSHQATGAQSIRVTGVVNNEGVFVGTNDTERVAGALSLDGSEAGYLFSKDTITGRLRGITLWARKK